MAAPQRRWAAELLYVWFHTLRPRDWFQPGPRVDSMLRERFGHQLAILSPRPSTEFLSDPATALASVLLFDQIRLWMAHVDANFSSGTSPKA